VHKLFLCLRYLRKRRIAFFGIAAVALCVGLLIVITSLFNGFIDALNNYWQRSWGQIVLTPRYPLHSFEELAEHIEHFEQVSRATYITNTGALLYLGPGDVRGVELQGIDLRRAVLDREFRKGMLLEQGESAQPSFTLSAEALAAFQQWHEKKFKRRAPEDKLPVGAFVGIGILAQPDEITDQYDRAALIEQVRNQTTPLIITTGKSSRPSADQAEAVKKIQAICWPVDVIETGIYQTDTTNVYLPFDYLRDLIGTDGPGGKECLGRILIFLEPNVAPAQIKDKLEEHWRQFARSALHWPESRIGNSEMSVSLDMPNVRLLTNEVKKQLSIMQMIIGLICLVAVLLIFVILLMIVMQKKKDIGILRAIGSSRISVAGLFLAYGGAIGCVGSGLGLLLGIWATRNINLIESVLTKLMGFKIWKSGVYLFSQIPNEVSWPSIVWILIVGVLTAIMGALLPALRAARLQPVQALRYE